jgi:hypothetical protein
LIRRLAALLAALSLLSSPAFADVSVGNGSVAIPLPFANVTGTVPVNQGGTNLTSYTAGQILYASASGTLAGLSDVATGQVLASGGTGTAPAFTANPSVTSLVLPVSGVIGNNTASSNIINFGTSGQNTYFELFNPSVSGTTELGTTGNTAGGVTGNLLGVAYSGHNALFAIDTSGDLGLGGYISPLHINQSAASQFAKRVALVAGSTTFTFPTAFNSAPVCLAVPEGTLSLGLIQVAPTTTNCVVTSAVGADTRTVDILVIGNPN